MTLTKDTIRRLPHKPGVYLMKGASGNVLYVGKAVDLRRRVSSHVHGRGGSRLLVRAAIPGVSELDYIVTDTEKEALLLENNLIKEHQPRYNVKLKDDSSCAHVRLSLNEEYPSLTITRRLNKDGARYFGPYSSADAARTTVRFLQRIFPLRSCSNAELSRRRRPCIKYQIGRCSGPCCGMIDRTGYRGLVVRTCLFLSGKTGSLVSLLEKEMLREAGGMRYERAGEIRNIIEAIRKTVERQKIVSPDKADWDAIGIYRQGGGGEAVILCVRAGRLIGKRAIALDGLSEDMAAIVREIILDHYLGGAWIPPVILAPVVPEDCRAIESLLAGEKGEGRVRIVAPRRGVRREFVALASTNAKASFISRGEGELDRKRILDEVMRIFHLPVPPVRIECVDVSNIAGDSAVGAVVAFRDGIPYKKGYRRFHIRMVGGVDDCRMIYEVIVRRIRKAPQSGGLPHLIMVDGGRGQLHAAVRAIADLGVKGVATIAIAKERRRGGRETPDRIFLEGRKNAIPLKAGSRITFFLQRIRDEAHRFAICGHRGLKRRRLLVSELEGIAGIGKKRSALLLDRFGDVGGIAAATLKELTSVLGDRGVAGRVHDYLEGARR